MHRCFLQFEEMYEQKRKEVNKAAEKFEKQLKAAKRSGSKATQDKVLLPLGPPQYILFLAPAPAVCARPAGRDARPHARLLWCMGWKAACTLRTPLHARICLL